ncbi:Flp family type IVb pilin [Nitrospira sp. M1]
MLTNLATVCRSFFLDEEGATALEYGLLGGLIAAVIVGAVSTLGEVLSTTFNNIAGSISSAIGS